jgi:hypothetical protein
MRPCSSYTSNSEQGARRAPAGHGRAVLQIVAWTFAFVALIDLAVNLAFPLPPDPKQRPGTLANYFDYGRSVEGKLRRTLGPDDAHASDVSVAGWLDRECGRPIAGESGRTTIAFYGMSFSNDVGDALAKIDPTVRPAFFAGPAAPPSHSLACFRMQQAHSAMAQDDHSSVQVLGILASSVKGLLSMTGATTGFEAPAPFTYPRYRVAADGQLQEKQPLVRSSEDWRRTLADPVRWRAFRQQLAANDAFYDPLLFEQNWYDRSSLLRMMRRGYAQQHTRALANGVLGPDGYSERMETSRLLGAVALDFARRARAAGKRPIVLLLHDGSSGDALFRLLSPLLVAEAVDYVSTHEVAPTGNPANFVGDGHFTPLANRRIADELRKVLARSPARPPGAAESGSRPLGPRESQVQRVPTRAKGGG